jgi:HD-GYP domain-containing protein (c-di-GMP phosphodiesterase class II)
MKNKKKIISLRYIVLITLFLVGVVPLVITGWFLSDRSARELRAVEGRYQTQLVQDKARQIEMFGQKYRNLVKNFADALEISNDIDVLTSIQTQEKIGESLKENPDLLAVYIKPIQAESISAFRSEVISQTEIEKLSSLVLGKITNKELVISEPSTLKDSSQTVLTIAAPVINEENISAAVVAIVSLNGISRLAVDRPMSEEELWKYGLPIIFVVDEKGRAISHPNSTKRKNLISLNHLKIVQEWKETNTQIQSALLPFNSDHKGVMHQMIGAYSTANFSQEMKFGVIVMQDEAMALASVGEMRKQTWVISLALAFITLLIGLILARQLTSPVLNLVSIAQKIAGGDLSTRISTKNVTEIGTLAQAFNTMSDELEEHITDLAKASEENRELFLGATKALAAAIDGKDRYTRGHSERVSRVSLAIGQRMGMAEEELETLRISALLHDIGKIGIDDSILKKPAALTDEEYEIMKTHPQKGYKIMKNIPAMKDFLPGMYMHHEMINGKGYPQGLMGDQIPLQAKIVSVADTFDAMTIDRPYSKGMKLDDALNRIGSFVGTRYDGKVVEALVQACADGQIGVGRVKLNSFKKKTPKKDEQRQPQKVA